MSLRRRSYLEEAVKKGPLRKTGIDGLSYRIETTGSKKKLVMVHDKTGLTVAQTTSFVKTPSKALKDIVAMLKSKFSDMDWTRDRSKLDMQRAIKASQAMWNIFREHDPFLISYKQTMKQKGFA